MARSRSGSSGRAGTQASAAWRCTPNPTGTPSSCVWQTRRTRSDGATPADSYLDIEKIVAVAEKAGADSVHPGYGFLAENRDFAQAVIDAGLVWIGPPPEAIENLGDKIKARHIAEKVGAPLAPGTKDPLENADQAVAFAEENGLPIAIKAAFGGGGRGLKIARKKEEVADAFESAVREAESAFGRGECFVEKFLDKPRHVETQCLADQHGNVVVISTRDCSLQRRNQKLVEEAPAPFLTDDQVSRLYESSKAILREANYVGAGTCEFLVAEDGTISFLEVNTRLQVEHCVSEEVTGIDLVREMFRIAAGEELGYADPNVVGHSIEFRINAEDGGANFMPAPGTLTTWAPPFGPGHPRRRRLRGGRDHPRRLRLADRQADRHRPRPHPGARALAPRAGGVPRRRHADGDPVPRRGGRATRPSSAPRPRSPRSSTSTRSGSRPTSTTRSPPTAATTPRRPSPTSATRSPSRSAAAGSRSCSRPGSPPSVAAAAGAKKPKRSSGKKAGAAASGDSVASPMQGTIVKVAVEEGATVEEGDVIVVLEAMKMEQPLKAHKAGTVSGLKAEVGSGVTNGEVICEIKDAE